jgi:uncharacterized ion transporter superfamily protein YfcC
MSLTTSSILLNQTTPAPSNQETKNSFCFSCGFNFGHIADGIEDTTMGIILVVIVMIIIAVCSCTFCYFYNRRKNKKYKKVQQTNDEEYDVMSGDKDDPK